MSLVERLSLADNEYCIENVPGDGNCFFHCISTYAHGNTLHSEQYRLDVCGNIFNNWQQLEHKVHLLHGGDMSKFLYWCSMIKASGWATNCETDATSLLYAQPEYDSGTNNSKDLPPAFHDHTYCLQHGFNQSKTLDSTNINPFLNEHSYSRQDNNTPNTSKGSLNDHLYCRQPGSTA